MTRNIAKNIDVEVALGTRKCDVDAAHVISKDEAHLAHYHRPQERKNICRKCASRFWKGPRTVLTRSGRSQVSTKGA